MRSARRGGPPTTRGRRLRAAARLPRGAIGRASRRALCRFRASRAGSRSATCQLRPLRARTGCCDRRAALMARLGCAPTAKSLNQTTTICRAIQLHRCDVLPRGAFRLSDQCLGRVREWSSPRRLQDRFKTRYNGFEHNGTGTHDCSFQRGRTHLPHMLIWFTENTHAHTHDMAHRTNV